MTVVWTTAKEKAIDHHVTTILNQHQRMNIQRVNVGVTTNGLWLPGGARTKMGIVPRFESPTKGLVALLRTVMLAPANLWQPSKVTLVVIMSTFVDTKITMTMTAKKTLLLLEIVAFVIMGLVMHMNVSPRHGFC